MVTELFGDGNRQPTDPLLERLRHATVGSYDVAGELGRGGMAVVYRGTDRKLERRVAIKVMDPRLSMTQGMAARFLQEARIAARLQHPNIIVVHDVRQSDDIIFFVMSLIDGVAVDELCRQPDPVPIDQVRWILLQATRALAYAHSEDIVHRDIKPANILLNLKGDVILTDFGIAKALGDTGLTQSGTQVGTPMYMSPEQFSGVPVGPASDQYALGVTAYQMLAGQPPFSGDLYQLIAAHGGKAPAPLRDLRPDCPPFLANAVMRMLEKQPENRWPSLEDLHDVFGANMAMDGGVARRNLAAAVRALHSGGASGTSASSDPLRAATPHSGEQSPQPLVVTISPPGATVFVSGSLELRASVSMDTGQSLPGAGVQWTSSNTSVLAVQSTGTVTGVAPGSAVVRASVNGGWSEATIRVEAAPIARLSMTTPNVTMRVGDVLRPDVIAMDVNGQSRDDIAMVWISRAPSVADLDGPGVIRAITPGLAVIDVSTGNVRRSIDVAVLRRPITRLRIGAAARVLQLGDASSLTIEAFDDLGTPVDATPTRWTSSAPSIIHVDSTGRALAIAPGVARITAAVDEATDGFELESLEPAIGSIQLMVNDPRIELGDEVTYSLRVRDISGASRSTTGVRVWSSDPHIVRVDDSGLRAVAVGIGETTLYAAPESLDANPNANMTASTVVRVTDVIVARLDVFPAALDIEVGSVAAVNLQALDRRGREVMSAVAVWTSDAPDIAVVEGHGIVRGLAPGGCQIRAAITNTDASTVEMVVPVRIRRASVARLTISAERSMLEVGETIMLRATTWDAMDVEVTDAVPVWRSTHPAIARVEANGQLIAMAAGRTTITAELEGKSGQLVVLIAPSTIVTLTIVPLQVVGVVGVPIPFSVAATDRNGQPATPTVSWTVEPADAGTVTANGEVTAMRAGTLQVRASLGVPADATGILSARHALSAVATITARAPRVVSIEFATPDATLAIGRTMRADVRATTDSHTLLPSTALTWTSANPEVLQVEATGELRAIAVGEARVTASTGEMESTMTVRVVTAPAAWRPTTRMVMAGAALVVSALAWMVWPKDDSRVTPPGASMSAVPAVVEAPRVSPTEPPSPPADNSTRAGESAPTPVNATPPAPSPKSVPKTGSPAASGTTLITSSKNPKPSPTLAQSAEPAGAKAPPATTGQYLPPIVTAPPTVVDAPPSRPPAVTPAATPAVTPATTPVGAPPVEVPSIGELRAIAEQIARQMRSGTLRTSPELLQFFNDGADHKVEIRTQPAMTDPEQGRVRTQFELALSRYSSGGLKENRFIVVRIEVIKRNGTPELIDKSFGPLTRSSGR